MLKKCPLEKKFLIKKKRLTYNYKNNVSGLHFKVPSGRLYCIYRHIYRLDLSKNMEWSKFTDLYNILIMSKKIEMYAGL